jgi:hypothetical protein
MRGCQRAFLQPPDGLCEYQQATIPIVLHIVAIQRQAQWRGYARWCSWHLAPASFIVAP